MMFRKSLLYWIIILIIFTSCNGKSDKGQIKTSPEDVTIGYSRLRISLPVFVAKEEGFFEKNGVNANLVMYETAQPLMQALVEGKVDVAGYTALPITYNGILRSGKELLFLTTMVEDQDHRISYFLRRREDSLSIQSFQDLRGKKVGILPTIAYKAWVEEILRLNDLIPGKDVIIQQIAPSQQPQALANKGVDILFTNDPSATSAIQTGIAELIFRDVECPKYLQDPFPFGSFNMSKEWAAKNPNLATAISKSLDEAVNFIQNNQQKAKQDMRAYLPEIFKDHVQYYPNARYLPTAETNESTLNNISDYYLKVGIIPQKLDLTGAVYGK